MKVKFYFLSAFFIIFFLVACSSENPSKKNSYEFVDQRSQNFKISTDFMTLKTEIKSKDESQDDKVIFVMFFDPKSSEAKNYFSNINHLFSNFPKIQILGILTQSSLDENLEAYAASNGIKFTLLESIDSKNIFADFINFNRLMSTQNQEDIHNTQDISSKDKKIQNLELPKTPYFVLYDKNGKKFQIYEGIILEEMFTYDISSLLRVYQF